MDLPTLTDYIRVICILFDQFEQERLAANGAKEGRPFTYADKMMVIFFLFMQFRRVYAFKTQWRWLKEHSELLPLFGWKRVPHRTTLARRYKALYTTIVELVAFVGQYVPELDENFSSAHLVEDKSLFKALGPVWHQSDRQAGRIPDGLRHLDTDASWSKSRYQGWVYGYGLHITCNEAAFPFLLAVETATVAESQVIEQKEATILHDLQPDTLAADNSYTKAMRIRRWAKQGVALLTPALKWVKGRFAQAYHRYIRLPDIAYHLRHRRTSVEPFFDLMAKVLGLNGRHKQLPVQTLPKVRTCLALATFSLQLAMLANSIWGLPVRNISHIAAVFT